jgi:glycosyltransferase involved in cell wall biosynthesis/GT2 family glycosyltransferase
VPVFEAADALRSCLDSLHRHVNSAHDAVLLVIDGPQSTAVERELLRAAGWSGFQSLRLPRRGGFAAAVNSALATTRRDVVLLNSDTVVTRGFLDKLAAAAAVSPRTGTVTPFTNNGTLASLPCAFEINRLPSGYDVDRFAALVEERSRRDYPEIPTGVGFCMLVKRDLLDEIGGFDADAFGAGYGEEVDLCRRAATRGWVHRLDDATFIFHEGQQSFGRERDSRNRDAQRRLLRRHPDYRSRIAEFMRADPVEPARRRIVEALRPSKAASGSPRSPARVVHVVHGWPPENFAGTEMYAWWLTRYQARDREVAVYSRSADRQFASGTGVELVDGEAGGARVRLRVRHFDERSPLRRNVLHDRPLRRDFAKFLDETRPELVHVHHLAGHGFSVIDEIVARGLPLVVQMQDWWLACARANLLDRGRHLCPGPAPERCAVCLPLTRLGGPARTQLNRQLYRLRERRARAAIASADAIVAGSAAILDSLAGLGWLSPGPRVHRLPYGLVAAPRVPRRPVGRPIRFGFIGSLLPHKGLHLATAALADLPPSSATLEVWGDPAADAAFVAEAKALAADAAVSFRGRFAEEARSAILAEIDVLLVPSLGLESFGFVAREALAAGVPVLASRRGALAEIFDGGDPRGALFDPGRPDELRDWIAKLVADPSIVERWRQMPPAPAPSFDEHAAAVDRVYAEVVARRRE